MPQNLSNPPKPNFGESDPFAWTVAIAGICRLFRLASSLLQSALLSSAGRLSSVVLLFLAMDTPFSALAYAQTTNEIQFNLLELPNSQRTVSQVNQPTAMVLQGPLRVCLQKTSENTKLALWIDRRVDPNSQVNYPSAPNQASNELSLSKHVKAICKAAGCDAGIIENVIYVGPAGSLAKVQMDAIVLHNQISIFNKRKNSTSDAQQRTLDWEELTTPRELLSKIESIWSVSTSGELPHDLMHANKIGPSTLATQLTLLAAGFEMRVVCSPDGKLTFEKQGSETRWRANYARKNLNPSAYAKVKEEFPDGEVKCNNATCTLTGVTEFHIALLNLRPVAPQKTRPAARDQEKYSIPTIQAPIQNVLSQLASRIGLEVTWSAQVTQLERQKIIKLSVDKPQTIDEILDNLANEHNLKITRSNSAILIEPQ